MDDDKCCEARAWIYEYLDQELSPDRQALVRQHLATCLECLERFRFEERLSRTIREKCSTIRAPDSLRRQIAALIGRM